MNPTFQNKAYSKYWRKDRSNRETTELALVLRALRKVAGHIGTNVKPIFWAGMTDAGTSSIIINPDMIRGTYPVSFHEMDTLVGKVVREAFCTIEWSEYVKSCVLQKFSPDTKSDTKSDKIKYLSGIIEAAEDIFINEYVNRIVECDVWPHYLATYWEILNKKMTRDLNLPPTVSSLTNTWRRIALFGTRFKSLHQYYAPILKVLTGFTEAVKKTAYLDTLAERREKRIKLYPEIITPVYEALNEWETFNIDDDAVLIRDEAGPKAKTEDIENGSEDKDDDEQNSSELDDETASEVSEILEEGETDITKYISVAIEDPLAAKMETTVTKSTALSNIQADPRQVKRIRDIFYKQKALHKKLSKKRQKRFLEEGKLDSRRLYRTRIDGRIFKKNYKTSIDKPWNILVLSDASASMSGKTARRRPWDFAERTFVSLVEASKGFNNNIEVYAYHEKNQKCVLIKLYHSQKVFTVAPFGRTPTGQAIMAAALMLKDKLENNLIIHITDGAANCGLNVTVPVDYCEKNGIILVTIGCNCNQQTEDFLRSRFPEKRLLLIDDIYALPQKIEMLFRQNLLKV